MASPIEKYLPAVKAFIASVPPYGWVLFGLIVFVFLFSWRVSRKAHAKIHENRDEIVNAHNSLVDRVSALERRRPAPATPASAVRATPIASTPPPVRRAQRKKSKPEEAGGRSAIDRLIEDEDEE